jgi:hypothetical protein
MKRAHDAPWLTIDFDRGVDLAGIGISLEAELAD